MSNLRELIEGVTKGVWHWDCDELKGVTPKRNRWRITTIGKTIAQWYYDDGDKTVEADIKLICHMRNHADAIADLIDAAESQHTGCKVLRCDVCEALAKLKSSP